LPTKCFIDDSSHYMCTINPYTTVLQMSRMQPESQTWFRQYSREGREAILCACYRNSYGVGSVRTVQVFEL